MVSWPGFKIRTFQIQNRNNYYNVTPGKATYTNSSFYNGDSLLESNLLNKTFYTKINFPFIHLQTPGYKT
jgi:hypothetical protein